MEQVVTLTELENDIVLLTMQDKDARNTFSKRLIHGIIEAFEIIEKKDTYKVVILTGYDNYFCCGGTKDELISIYNKEISFNDLDFFTNPLVCKVPVIAAMQGHAIGGGLVFACYSDFLIFGKECIYTTNFMKYGFTPGMGGTCIVPYRLGHVIGNEMLFTAENYRGGKLKERGIPHRIVPRNKVMEEAINLANVLAEKPRLSLITLKEHLTKELKSKIDSAINEELRMHEITFHQEEVKQRIEKLFGR